MLPITNLAVDYIKDKFNLKPTTGEQLGLALNLDPDNVAVIQKAINIAYPLYRVVIDSRHPYRQILFSRIKQADSLKSGQYDLNDDYFKSLKFTPPVDLWKDFQSNINSKAIVILNDLAAEMYLGENIFEYKYEGKELREFTIADFRNNISDVSKYWANERKRVAGQETSINKLIEFKEPGTFVFLTEPTYDSRVEIYPKGKYGGTDNLYTLQIQVKDFEEWSGDPLQLTFKEFNEILKVADILLDSDDPSFALQGFRKQLQDVDSAIYPVPYPDKGIWAARHNGALLSKHLYWLLHYINFYIPAMYRKMKDYYLEKYGKIEPKQYKPGKIKIKKRSAKDIVPRPKD